MDKGLLAASLLIVGFITMLVIGTDLFVASTLQLPISESSGTSIGQAGLSMTALSFANIVGALCLAPRVIRSDIGSYRSSVC